MEVARSRSGLPICRGATPDRQRVDKLNDEVVKTQEPFVMAFRFEHLSSSVFGTSWFVAVLAWGLITCFCGCGCTDREITDRLPKMPVLGDDYATNATVFAKDTIRSWIRSPDAADISIDDTSVFRKQGNSRTRDTVFTATGTVLLSNKAGNEKRAPFFIKVRGEEETFECTMLDIGNVPLVNTLGNVRLGPSDRLEVPEQDDISDSLLLDRL